MAPKKPSKSVSTEEKKAPVVAPQPNFKSDPIMGAAAYLMSVGVRADHIESRVVWAQGNGLTVATFSQWKKLFSKF